MNQGIYYLYEYETGQRKRNLGFLQISHQYRSCMMTLHLKSLQKLYLPFNKVWYPKTPTPYGILVAQGYLQKQPMSLLNMLYELFSLILYNNNPVVVNKLPIDVQALFNKYQKISNKFDFVDFAVIGNSIPLPY